MTCRAPDNTTTCAGTPTGAQLAYDNEGRLATWQNTTPLSHFTTSDSFLYDGAGNRVEQLVTINGSILSSTTYVAGGLEEIASTALSSTLTKYFTGAGGLPTAERVGTNGPLSYLATDGQGTVSTSLDGAGNVTSSQLYTPYGNSRYSSGSSPTTLGYTGQRADGATGLDYYNARYYDPVAGQFASADTVADGLNRYGYVAGNPTTATDPSGHREYLGGWDASTKDCWISDACPGRPPTCATAPVCLGGSGGDGNGTGNGNKGPCSPSVCPPKPQPVPCANQQNQCTNPPSSGTGGEALRIQNARNDAAQGLQWLQNLESLYNNIANLFSGQLADIVGKILGLKVGLEYLHTYTEELVNLVRGQVSWKDSMWTSENVANLQLQVELVAAKWMAEANLVGSLFVVAAVAIPFLDIAIGTVAIAYGTFQAGAAVDVAAAQASIDQEQWSLAGF